MLPLGPARTDPRVVCVAVIVMGLAADAPGGVDDAPGALDGVPEGLDDAPQAETTSARRGTPSDRARFEPMRKRGVKFTCWVPLTALLTDVVVHGYGQGLRDHDVAHVTANRNRDTSTRGAGSLR